MTTAKHQGHFGWDKGGNCVWCGEAGRCRCDHPKPKVSFPEEDDIARAIRTHLIP